MNETCTLVLEPALVLSSTTERRKNVQLPKLAGKVLSHYLQGLTGWEAAGEEQKLPPADRPPLAGPAEPLLVLPDLMVFLGTPALAALLMFGLSRNRQQLMSTLFPTLRAPLNLLSLEETIPCCYLFLLLPSLIFHLYFGTTFFLTGI